MAIENAKNGKPFKEEFENKKLKKYWSITKIIAGILNAFAIILIAIWTELNSGKNSTIENNIRELKKEHKIEMIKKPKKTDSWNKTTKNLSI